jgi:queuosine precursor transporter
MIYVILYLVAIVIANILILLYNPETVSMTLALVAETGISFFLIGLDLSVRDKLHDYWKNRTLWPKMVTLIVSGSLITIIFNLEALQIAFASCSAFLLAGLTDTLIYQRLRKKRFLIRANGSNLGGAAVDSVVFPLVAFGFYPGVIWIILGQFVAKVLGGALWAFVIDRFRNESGRALEATACS